MTENLLLAIDVGGTKVAAGAFRRGSASPIARITSFLPTAATIDDVLSAVKATASAIAEQIHPTDPMPFTAVGVACPGLVRDGRVDHAPHIDGLAGVDFLRSIRTTLNTHQVALGHDVKLAAAAEAAYGRLLGIDPGLYINLGTGLAGVAVCGGRVIGGHTQAAGEIGYAVLDSRSRAGTGPGEPPLEGLIGGRAVGAMATELLGRPVDAVEAFSAGAQVPALSARLDAAVDALGAYLVNVTLLMDFESVVLGGGLTGADDFLLPRLNSWLVSSTLSPPRLQLSAFPADAALIGAALLAEELGDAVPGARMVVSAERAGSDV